MNTKLFTAGVAGVVALAAIAFAGCQKEELISANRNESITGQKGGNPTVQTLNPPVGGKAYSAVFTPSIACGPMLGQYNSAVRYFNATNGTGEVIVNDQVCLCACRCRKPAGM